MLSYNQVAHFDNCLNEVIQLFIYMQDVDKKLIDEFQNCKS